MILLSNVRFGARWRSPSGVEGEARFARGVGDYLRQARACDVVLVDSSPGTVMRLLLAFRLLPWLRRPLIASDMQLRKPRSDWERAKVALQRRLLAHVDHFFHLFPDLSGYEKYFGVGPDRSTFVPFKPNLRDHVQLGPNPEGEYVLAYGFSLRDFDTFFAAVEQLPYPAAIVRPDITRLRLHHSRFTRPLDLLPPQVRLLDHDPASYASQVEVLMGARIVVVPMLKDCLQMSGSIYNAMLMGKCVIVTEGPASRGLVTDQALTVPPENPAALAAVIRRAWEDDALRLRTAARGYELAFSLGGAADYRGRLLDATVAWMRARERTLASGAGAARA